jgi:hypothetical protein
MDPTTLITALLSTSWEAAKALLIPFLQAAVRAILPLLAGIAGALIAGACFILFLEHRPLDEFFTSAAEVGAGVFIALIVNGSFHPSRSFRATAVGQEARAGTVALATIGTLAALIGHLTTDGTLSGVLFALTWGGLTAGVLGLVYFVRTEPTGPSVGVGDIVSRGDVIINVEGGRDTAPPIYDPAATLAREGASSTEPGAGAP